MTPRKKYSTHIEVGPRQDEPPVSAPPEITAAELPPAAEPKPIEQPETESPVEKAARNELKKRLEEMERAEGLQRRQPPQRAAEPQQPQEPIDPIEFVLANSGLPEGAKAWLRKHPEYVLDPEKNAELQHFHYKARREAGSEFDDGYYGVLERHLGIAARTNGHTETKPTVQPTNYAEQRNSVPQRQLAPQRMSVPVSAPPTREAPSMTTGRMPSRRAPLSRDELEIAQGLGMTAEQYQAQKEKMLRMKAAGEMQ